MAGGNFTDRIAVDKNGTIVPSGPLTTQRGETVSKVYVWVFQLNDDGSGAFAAGLQEQFGGGEEEWRVEAPIHEGRFRPGPAVGMAVVTSVDSGEKTVVYSWMETITLLEQSEMASS